MGQTWMAVLLTGVFAGAGLGPGRGPKADTPRFEIDHNAGRVVRLDAAGKVVWSTRLDGSLGPAAKDALAWDDWRVYVPRTGGVTALDAATGRPRWHAQGPSRYLLVSGRLLLATGQQGEAGWLVARGSASGAVVFRVRLAEDTSAMWSVRDVAGLFLVQGCAALYFGEEGEALLIDRQGGVRHRFPQGVIDALGHRQAAVFLTGKVVTGFSPDGKARWSTPVEGDGLRGGGLVEAGGEDVVAFRYGPISDSGVRVVRLNAATGKVAWRAHCARLGVGHSQYRHRATVTVVGDRLRVTSHGSYGTFVEVLDLRTGKQLKRTE
jgi:outer membrane protein assembly factor BamB